MMMQRSLQLLEMPTDEERKEFADSVKEVPLVRSVRSFDSFNLFPLSRLR